MRALHRSVLRRPSVLAVALAVASIGLLPPRADAGVVPTVDVIEAAVVEGSNAEISHLSFLVSLSEPRPVGTVIMLATVNGTAVGGITPRSGDFVSRPGTRVFIPRGETLGVVNISVLGDNAVEADETMTLVIVRAPGAIIGQRQATGAILDDDVAQAAELTVTADAPPGHESIESPLRLTVACARREPSNRRTIVFGFTRRAQVNDGGVLRMTDQGVYAPVGPDNRLVIRTPKLPAGSPPSVTDANKGQPTVFFFFGSNPTLPPEHHPAAFAATVPAAADVTWRVAFAVNIDRVGTVHFIEELHVLDPRPCGPGDPVHTASVQLSGVPTPDGVLDPTVVIERLSRRWDAQGLLRDAAFRLRVPNIRPRCSRGGSRLPTEVRFIYDDWFNLVPVPPSRVITAPDGSTYTHDAVRRVADPQAGDIRFGGILLPKGAAFGRVVADVIARCRFGRTVVTSVPAGVLPSGGFAEVGGETDEATETLVPLSFRLPPAGGIRFR
jgi:hypothetical protein